MLWGWCCKCMPAKTFEEGRLGEEAENVCFSMP